MKITSLSILLSASMVLSACLGGGSGYRPGPESIRELTGLAPPAETAAQQDARSPGIVTRGDSLVVTTAHGETNQAERPRFSVPARCSGTRCVLRDPETGVGDVFDKDDLEFVNVPSTMIGTGHGITLRYWSGHHDDTDYAAYGSWMEHSGFVVQTQREEFVVQTQREEYEGVWVAVRFGIAGGELTGTKPVGSATWLGLMVGTPATGNDRGDRLQGIAALNYDMDAGGLDVGFSGIKNVDRGADHSTPVVMFDDITIASDGTFQAGATGNRIQGGFYGPEHVEAAGVFEQANIVGAFGAKRQ